MKINSDVQETLGRPDRKWSHVGAGFGAVAIRSVNGLCSHGPVCPSFFFNPG